MTPDPRWLQILKASHLGQRPDQALDHLVELLAVEDGSDEGVLESGVDLRMSASGSAWLSAATRVLRPQLASIVVESVASASRRPREAGIFL